MFSDSVRCQNRIESVYRSRGIATAGRDVYRISPHCGHDRSLATDLPLAVGTHRFVWDGRDDAGRSLPAGTYFVRVRAGSFEAIQSLVKVH